MNAATYRLYSAYVDELALLDTATTPRDYRATWGRLMFRWDALRLLIEDEYENQPGMWESSPDHIIVYRERLDFPAPEHPELVAGVKPTPPAVTIDPGTDRWASMMPPAGYQPPDTAWIISELQAGRNPYQDSKPRFMAPDSCIECSMPMVKRDRKIKGWVTPPGHVAHSAKGYCTRCYKAKNDEENKEKGKR